jgi:cytochrome c oxidase subunit I+III
VSTERLHESAIDVSGLPSYAFGHRSMMWWGVMGMIVIEGTVFALAAFAYLYVRALSDVWPPVAQGPDLRWGTVNTLVLVASLLPNQWAKRAAERLDLRQVQVALILCLLFSLAFLGVRVLEFGALNCRWDTNAYGSTVWMLMGLHTVHLLTDTYDSAVLTVLMHAAPVEGKNFVDVSESAFYWYFVVLAWLPIYGLVYCGPALL